MDEKQVIGFAGIRRDTATPVEVRIQARIGDPATGHQLLNDLPAGKLFGGGMDCPGR
jgi:hypothetical protein